MKKELKNPIDEQHDVQRLGEVITHLSVIYDLMYHMDEKEYKRMRDYILNRFDTRFPYDNPALNNITS